MAAWQQSFRCNQVDPLSIQSVPHEAEKFIVFDKLQDVSAKDHERMRRAAEVPIDYELSITSPLPKREATMKSENNKRKLASVGLLFTFTIGDMTTTESRDDSAFDQD